MRALLNTAILALPLALAATAGHAEERRDCARDAVPCTERSFEVRDGRIGHRIDRRPERRAPARPLFDGSQPPVISGRFGAL